ncbi:hypothetical protein P7H14_02365 [Paenibacillus larvae]|nr:hypothetical protein [Paenibacillus larvae]MDT2191304.1 hypothetical protein [Paenibacillus larvae]
MLDLQGSQSTVLVRMNVTAHRHSVSIQNVSDRLHGCSSMQIDRLVAFIHSALFGLLPSRYFCQFGMFIHCHPHLSILDLFLIRQMVPFSLPRFAKNIDSTYIKLPFIDTNELSDEDKGYLAVGVEKGLIYGFIESNGERTFRPHDIITRAQYAGILGNAGDLVQDPTLVKGRISAVAPGQSLQVTTDLGETFTYPFYKDAHVYKNGSKVSSYALNTGDQIKLRHHYGSAVFIEVTKNAGITPDFTVTGEFEGMLVNSNGQITTVSLKRALNGSAASTRYTVSPNVVIYGKESDLTVNKMIKLDGKDGVIVAIYLTPQK